MLKVDSSNINQGGKLLLMRAVILVCVMSVTLLSACAPQPVVESKRFFWPLPVPGVEPKIEYVGFYQSDEDVVTDKHAWADTYILGEYEAYSLFSSPFGVGTHSGQRLFVTDTSRRIVVVLDLVKEEVRVLKDQNGESHHLLSPTSVSEAADGSVLVVDSVMGRVFKYDANERYAGTVSDHLDLSRPIALTVDNKTQRLYLVDIGAHNVVIADLSGNLISKFGERGHSAGEFNFPIDIDLDEEGNVYVLDSLNFRVQVFSPEGKYLYQFGEQGTVAGAFRMPKGIAVSPEGFVCVTDALSHKFVVFDKKGEYLMTIGDRAYHLDGDTVSPGGFYLPKDIHADSNGGLWVVDSLNKMVHKFQYLTDDYLRKFPIDPDQVYFPKGVKFN